MARYVLLASWVVIAGCTSGGEIPEDGGSSTGGSTVDGNGGTAADGGASSNGGSLAIGGSNEGGLGAGGSPEAWPTCDTQPPGSPTKTLEEIWQDNPSAPTAAWVPGVYVTAVSKDGCTDGAACQIFVQQDESYASLAAATHQSLRIGIAPAVASYFTGIAVGDRVDLYAHAVRDTMDGKNELNFLVVSTLPGCMKVIGAGDPAPLTVTLDDLTVAAYEDEIGPVLVNIDLVSGSPDTPAETFALWNTGEIGGGDITTVTSLSPFFLPGATFNGLTEGTITDFTNVVGVFGLFVPPADPLIKYEEIYVRSGADYPVAN